MNRRGFLENMLAGAAAVVGLGVTVGTIDAMTEVDARREIAEHEANDTDLVMGYINRGEVIPPGVYRLGGPIVTSRSVIGSGAGKTILRFPSNADPLISLTGSTGQHARDLYLIRD